MIASLATAAQAAFAFFQWKFSERSFSQQLAAADDASKEQALQTTRIIASAERIASSSERSLANNERAVRDTLEQGKRAIDEASANNERVARLVRDVQGVFAAQALPLVKIVSYQFEQPLGPPGCSNPPTGIAVIYENRSTVTIRLLKQSIWMHVDGKELAPKAWMSGAKLVSPKEQAQAGARGQVVRQAYLARQTDDAPPISAAVDLLYETLPAKHCFLYTGTIEMKPLCRIPNQTHFNIRDEDLTPVRCPS